jgi:DNA modification methylase
VSKANPKTAALGGGGLANQMANGDATQADETTGTSIFDPVMCELAYRWFCPPGGRILDPFAGGSVRGIVAAKLGRDYQGHELRPEQIAANRKQASDLLGKGDGRCAWIEGDSRDTLPYEAGPAYDLVFTCPPYADLEVYSDDRDRDLSAMAYPQFVAAYRDIIAKSCACLRPDRFAAIVVGDVRGPDGSYRGFPWDTVAAFRDAGLALYNEAILVTAVGSLPVRARKGFEASRKMGKTHQNLFVFVKGSASKAARAIGDVDFGTGDPFEALT